MKDFAIVLLLLAVPVYLSADRFVVSGTSAARTFGMAIYTEALDLELSGGQEKQFSVATARFEEGKLQIVREIPFVSSLLSSGFPSATVANFTFSPSLHVCFGISDRDEEGFAIGGIVYRNSRTELELARFVGMESEGNGYYLKKGMLCDEGPGIFMHVANEGQRCSFVFECAFFAQQTEVGLLASIVAGPLVFFTDHISQTGEQAFGVKVKTSTASLTLKLQNFPESPFGGEGKGGTYDCSFEANIPFWSWNCSLATERSVSLKHDGTIAKTDTVKLKVAYARPAGFDLSLSLGTKGIEAEARLGTCLISRKRIKLQGKKGNFHFSVSTSGIIGCSYELVF
ncbi:MAG: hypothetical protein LKE40_00980 [Spirochaetia bacterium]|jgi:hypothetical protein|nr:hypothetical protein [Spirochaetia bacterium]